jgi:multiple sugar transport system ATP-binding protein
MEVVPDVTEELGSEIHVIFSIDAPPVVTEEVAAAQSEEGSEEALAPLSDGRATFTARVDAQSKARPREPIRLTIDPGRLHFFDPSTGRAIEAQSRAPAAAQR